NTLTKLTVYGQSYNIPLLFITKFTNLQQLRFLSKIFEENFKIFQYATFSQLKILEIPQAYMKYELLLNFIEINGKNLKECYLGNKYLDDNNGALNLAIAKYCPNLRILSAWFKSDELETLKIVFNNCQYLED